MRGSLPVLGLLLGANACSYPRYAGPWWITPLDGFTGLDPNAALHLVGPTATYPDDYPAAPWITVVDLEHGGVVPGTLVDVKYKGIDEGVDFVPEAPWAPGRYVWTIDDPQGASHGPKVWIDASEMGSAVFDTRPGLRALDVGFDADGRACLLLSHTVPGDRVGGVRVTVDGQDAGVDALEVLPHEDWGFWSFEIPAFDVDVACLPASVPVEVGALVRVWFDGDGPWLAEATDASPADLFGARHRFVAYLDLAP